MGNPMPPAARPAKGGATGRRLLTWVRAELVYGLELAALVALALTQPVLDLFGRAPDVFVFEGADRSDVIAFAALFSLVPLGLLWALEAGVGVVHGRARRGLHIALVAVAAALVTVNAVKQLSSVRGPLAVALAVGGAVAAGVAYATARVARQFLQMAGAALPLFVVLFLLVSPVGALVRPGDPSVDRAKVEETPPVVMLMLDELPLASLLRRDGSIDSELYPNFARLARLTNWYPNATTVSSATWYAVPSLLSGRMPHGDSLPLVTDWPDNLFTVLGDDYRLEVQEALTGLCPLSRCPREGSGGGLRAMAERGLRVYRDVVSPEDSQADPTATFVEPGSKEDRPGIGFDAFERFQPDRFNRFLDRIGSAREPAVHYLHLLFPHTPWRLFPSGREYANSEHNPGAGNGGWAEDEWAALQGRQRHLLQTRYVDGLVGALLDRLEETGLLEPSLLVVTSDHGIAFQPGQPSKGNFTEDLPVAIAPEMAWVPLFVKTPGQAAGETDDRNALLVDVLPTIADVLDVDLPRSVEGRSLLGPPRPETTKPYWHAYDSSFFGVHAGDRNEIPLGRRSELAALGVDALGRGSEPDLRLHAIGPRADLVGRPVADLASGSPADFEVRLADDPFRSSAPDAEPLPAFLDGTLSGDPGPGAAVAIAVNGVIGAVSPVFTNAGAAHAFAGLVPEAQFRDGPDDLSLYLVSTRPGDLSARPLERGGP